MAIPLIIAGFALSSYLTNDSQKKLVPVEYKHVELRTTFKYDRKMTHFVFREYEKGGFIIKNVKHLLPVIESYEFKPLSDEKPVIRVLEPVYVEDPNSLQAAVHASEEFHKIERSWSDELDGDFDEILQSTEHIKNIQTEHLGNYQIDLRAVYDDKQIPHQPKPLRPQQYQPEQLHCEHLGELGHLKFIQPKRHQIDYFNPEHSKFEQPQTPQNQIDYFNPQHPQIDPISNFAMPPEYPIITEYQRYTRNIPEEFKEFKTHEVYVYKVSPKKGYEFPMRKYGGRLIMFALKSPITIVFDHAQMIEKHEIRLNDSTVVMLEYDDNLKLSIQAVGYDMINDRKSIRSESYVVICCC